MNRAKDSLAPCSISLDGRSTGSRPSASTMTAMAMMLSRSNRPSTCNTTKASMASQARIRALPTPGRPCSTTRAIQMPSRNNGAARITPRLKSRS
jgi:hypothetical protein